MLFDLGGMREFQAAAFKWAAKTLLGPSMNPSVHFQITMRAKFTATFFAFKPLLAAVRLHMRLQMISGVEHLGAQLTSE
jgi:hypothetical protein